MVEPPDKDKVQPIRQGIPVVTQPDQAAKEMRAYLSQSGFKDFLDAMAEYDWLRFHAYKRAGFNDAQALFLTRKDQ